MQFPLQTKLKLGFVEKDSSNEGKITLSVNKLEDNIKMNPTETQCLVMEWT